jgi:hypothetical protein
MSRFVKVGVLAAALSVLAATSLNAGPLKGPEALAVKRTAATMTQDNPYLQQCLNTCSMENSIRWAACSANGATNPSVEACRNLSYQLYSACVTNCYGG